MTDERDHAPIDLSALEPFPDSTREDRVIGRAMTRIRATRSPAEPRHLLGDISTFWRPVLAAASIIAAVAGIALATTARPDAASSEQVRSTLLEWAQSGHVPSNGELIATFAAVER